MSQKKKKKNYERTTSNYMLIKWTIWKKKDNLVKK